MNTCTAPRMGDLIAAARACLPVTQAHRRWFVLRMLAEARAARDFRCRSGRMHPFWGDGTLMAAALRRSPPQEPPLSDAEWRACLTLCLGAIGDAAEVRRGRTRRAEMAI